jgi:membrane protease YdiL (CAAX protease family)
MQDLAHRCLRREKTALERTEAHIKTLVRFFLLTFALSWSAWGACFCFPDLRVPLLVVGTFGPAIAALIILAGTQTGIRPTLSRLLIWRFPLWLYAYAAGLTVVGGIIALAIARLATGSGPIWPEPMSAYVPALVFIYVLIFSVAGEELGWRGVALPALLKWFPPVGSSLIVGVIWATWHLPLFFVPDNFHADIPLVLFAVQIIASSVIYTQLHLASRGSLLIAHLFHAAFNTTVGLLPILPNSRSGDAMPLMIGVGLLVVLAVCVAWRMPKAKATDLRQSWAE